jgi:methylase of polypeptide subunit release factors
MSRMLRDGDLVLELAPHVHVPDAYSAYLADAIDVSGARTACDLTAGCGYQSLKLARCGLTVVSVDLLPEAARLTERNAVRNDLGHLVDARAGDLYGVLRVGERFDLIVAWPPVMPTPDEQAGDDWWSVANNGGQATIRSNRSPARRTP